MSPLATAKAYFIKTLAGGAGPGEGVKSPSELHRLTAVVRTLNVGDVEIEDPIDFLESVVTEFSEFGKSFLDKCFGQDCVRYQSTTEYPDPQFPAFVFLISKDGFFVLHSASPMLVINVEYRQYYARGVQPLSAEALETEVEPFQKSLEFTAIRPIAGVSTSDRWKAHMRAGSRAVDRQDWSEAEASFKAALDEKESFGPRLAVTLYYLAFVQVSQSRYEQAEPLYRRALAIYEQQPGANQEPYGQTLSDLGALYTVQGQYEQAEPLLKRSLAVRETALGLEHRDVGQSLYNLMDLYVTWDRWTEAEPFARRALPIYERAKGREVRWLGKILHTLGLIYEKQGKLTDAEPLLKRGLTITERALDPQYPEVAHQLEYQLEDYAAILRKEGRQPEAEELEARARAIRGKASSVR